MSLSAARAAILCIVLGGCATWQEPADVSDAVFRGRAITAVERGARVAAAALSAEDSLRMFGTRLDNAQVQPVWVEVQNSTSAPLWLLPTGSDPDYFSPLEVAWSVHTPLASGTNATIDRHFEKLAFKNPIAPGATRTGVLFTNSQPLTKLLNIDLFGRKTLIPFTLFLPVTQDPEVPEPGGAPSLFRYPDKQITDYQDMGALRAALERLPCCAAHARSPAQSEPLNAALVGEIKDIGAAVVRRHYRRDARPVDTTQQVFGREPDIVLRKHAQAGAPATWIRLWLAPLRFEGRSVYLAQVGRPVGGRFVDRDTAALVLHGDVDEARNLLIQDMMYSGGLEKLGFVHGVGAVSGAQSPTVADGARYHTDGLRAVLFFAPRPLSLSDVELLDWVPFATQSDYEHRQTGR